MSMASSDRPPLDVLVIGGGQAGLAMGYQLTQDGRRFEIVDAAPEVGHAWRSRWDSLRLFTSGRYDNLPGLPFPAAADAYPGKEDVADYLQSYAAEFRLPVRLNTEVTSLTRTDGVYVAKTGRRPDRGSPGGARHRTLPGPVHPAGLRAAAPRVIQLHSSDYRRPDDLPRGRVLVVGASNSGCQIALELSTSRTVELSVGQRWPTIPQRPLGRDVWSWATGVRPGPSHRGVPARPTPVQARSDHRDRAQTAHPSPRDPGPAPCDKNGRAVSDLRRRLGVPSTTPLCGRPASPTTTHGSTSPASSTRRAGSDTREVSHPPQACTRSASPGNTPAAPRCSAGWKRRRLPRSADRGCHPTNTTSNDRDATALRRRLMHVSPVAERSVGTGHMGSCRRRGGRCVPLCFGGCPQRRSTPAG